MKGTFFQKPYELRLQVEGESWQQGDRVSGSLTVKNHGGQVVSLEDLRVALAVGELKKVRQKAPDAFEIIASGGFEARELEPQKEATFPWTFETPLNFPITDSWASPFILYGQGQLQLPFRPAWAIDEFLKELQTQFRFVQKAIRSRKGWVEAKLEPPSAKAFAMLDQLVLSFRFEGEILEAQYNFQVKKIEASAAAAMDLKKLKKELTQAFTPAQYRLPSGRPNHEHLVASMREALKEVEAKVTF